MWDVACFIIIIIIFSFFASFSHQRLQLVFTWNLSDCNYLQVSRTLLSIPTNLRNVVVLNISIFPLIYVSSSLFEDRSMCINYRWYHRFHHVPHLLQLSGKILVSFHFFHYLCVIRLNGKIQVLFFLFFLVNSHEVWSSRWDRRIYPSHFLGQILLLLLLFNLQFLTILHGFFFTEDLWRSSFVYVCVFVWVLWHINLCRLFNAKSIFIQFCFKQFSLA